jgi:hypothetical protein
MKKLLILTLAMCLLATASFATYTRVKTLGEANMIVPDEHNIWLFPSTINDYPELFLGEFTTNYAFYPDKENGYYYNYSFGPGYIPNLGYISPYYDGYTNLGTHLKFGEDNPFVLGVYFTESRAFTPIDFIHPNYWWEYWMDMDWDEVNDFDYEIMKNQRIDLFYGRNLGENKFGFHFGWVKSGWDESWDEGEDSYNPKEGINMFNLGLGLGMMDNKLDLGLDFKTLSWTDEDSDGEKESESDGSMALTLAARYFNEMNQKCTLVPHGQITYEKLGVKYPEDEYKASFTEMAIDLGVGMHYVPAAGILAVTDFGLIYNTEKVKFEATEGDEEEELKLNTMTLPYFKVGLEATIFDWFDLRMGGVNYWMWDKWDFGDGEDYENWEYKENYVYTEFYLGGGFHWGNLFIDAYANPQILTDGLYFINGHDTEPFAYQVSLKYKMF